MKLFMLGMCALIFAGCASMNPFATAAKAQLEAVVDIAAAGTYEMQYTVKKNGVVLSTQTIIYECVPTEGTLPSCTKK